MFSWPAVWLPHTLTALGVDIVQRVQSPLSTFGHHYRTITKWAACIINEHIKHKRCRCVRAELKSRLLQFNTPTPFSSSPSSSSGCQSGTLTHTHTHQMSVVVICCYFLPSDPKPKPESSPGIHSDAREQGRGNWDKRNWEQRLRSNALTLPGIWARFARLSLSSQVGLCHFPHIWHLHFDWQTHLAILNSTQLSSCSYCYCLFAKRLAGFPNYTYIRVYILKRVQRANKYVYI